MMVIEKTIERKSRSNEKRTKLFIYISLKKKIGYITRPSFLRSKSDAELVVARHLSLALRSPEEKTFHRKNELWKK